MQAGLNAQPELLATVRGTARGRTAELECKRCDLGGRVASVGRERECWPLGCEGDAADEEVSTVGESGTGVCETSKRVGRPGSVCNSRARGGQGGAIGGRGALQRPAERRDLA